MDPVPLVCRNCSLHVSDTTPIELCAECDELHCGDCASVVMGRYVCLACKPTLIARMERLTLRATEEGARKQLSTSAPSSLAAVPSPPKSATTGTTKKSSGFLDRFLASSPQEEQSKREKDAKRVARQRLEREQRIRDSTRVWKDDVIPQWVKVCTSRKVRELCWMGIPTSLRKEVWPLLIGNRLSISPELFEIHGGRAFEVRKQPVPDNEGSNKEQSVLLIPVDIGRTFPLLGFFQACN
jgi:hypothetical protein